MKTVEKPLAINIQPKKTSENKILLLAYISTGKFKTEEKYALVDSTILTDEFGNELGTSPVYDLIKRKI
ncbi:MAG: hypothetical protein IPP38_12475 [Bacteroidetes bacterium]|nr:hypothetical protein [Bacteroidota bacterium]